MCMRVCVYVRNLSMCVCAYVCVYVCVYVYICVYHICVYMCVCVYVCMCVCVYVCMCSRGKMRILDQLSGRGINSRISSGH